MREYDRELEQKDEEILRLRARPSEDELEVLLGRLTATIALLEGQVARERREKGGLAARLAEVEAAVRALGKDEEREAEERLIEELSAELERKMAENGALRLRVAEVSAALEEGGAGAAAGLRRENAKLRELNRRMKRYTLELEREVKAVCGIDECESHRACV